MDKETKFGMLYFTLWLGMVCATVVVCDYLSN
jgi:hypothetical protein